MKLSIFIPIHELKKEEAPLLNTALNSLASQRISDFKVDILTTEESKEVVSSVVDEFTSLDITTHYVEGDTRYQVMVNYYATDILSTDYFTILQYDDALNDNFVKIAMNYMESEKYQDTDVFFNIIHNVDSKGKLYGFSNEMAWVGDRMDEQGVLDRRGVERDRLEVYSWCGAIIKKEIFKETIGFKLNLPVFFDAEFMLRLIEQGYKIFIIPRVMYKHLVNREGSIDSNNLKRYTDSNEVKWWLMTAKNAAYTDVDEEYNYQPNA